MGSRHISWQFIRAHEDQGRSPEAVVQKLYKILHERREFLVAVAESVGRVHHFAPSDIRVDQVATVSRSWSMLERLERLSQRVQLLEDDVRGRGELFAQVRQGVDALLEEALDLLKARLAANSVKMRQ